MEGWGGGMGCAVERQRPAAAPPTAAPAGPSRPVKCCKRGPPHLLGHLGGGLLGGARPAVRSRQGGGRAGCKGAACCGERGAQPHLARLQPGHDKFNRSPHRQLHPTSPPPAPVLAHMLGMDMAARTAAERPSRERRLLPLLPVAASAAEPWEPLAARTDIALRCTAVLARARKAQPSAWRAVVREPVCIAQHTAPHGLSDGDPGCGPPRWCDPRAVTRFDASLKSCTALW